MLSISKRLLLVTMGISSLTYRLGYDRMLSSWLAQKVAMVVWLIVSLKLNMWRRKNNGGRRKREWEEVEVLWWLRD
jgi:GH24 family phage-related lysozyme (muramidase)